MMANRIIGWSSLALIIAAPVLMIFVNRVIAVGPPYDVCGNSRNMPAIIALVSSVPCFMIVTITAMLTYGFEC